MKLFYVSMLKNLDIIIKDLKHTFRVVFFIKNVKKYLFKNLKK